MGTRRERVILELDDRFTSQLGRPAAATKAFNRELKELDRGATSFTRTALTIERDSANVSKSIDRLSGRLALFAQSAAALGPALVPIGAAAIPALAGLTTQLGFTIAAAGSTVLAFQGVGDALDAMSKAQLDPSVANLRKAEQALDALSAPAFNFVLQLREMAPAFKEVRDAAEEGLFPGLSASLDEVESLLPTVASIVGEITSTIGDLANASAESLAGPEWEEFFAFIEREARPTLSRLGESVGNVARGVADMWMAFDPLSDDFQDGLVSASEAFEDWAANLSKTEGFAEFVAYVRETGPQVLETIGSIANALIQVAEAAAPLGGPVLQVLEAVADVVATIADSELGTPIMAAVAAMSALNLATVAFNKTSQVALGTRAGSGLRAGVQGFTRDLEVLASTALTAGAKTERQLARSEAAAKGLGSTLGKGALVAGGAAAGYAALESGILGTNAAMGAAVGLVAGPWGAAIGAGTGTILDFASANDAAEASVRGLEDALEGTDFSAVQVAARQLGEETDAFEKNASRMIGAAKLIPVAGVYISAGAEKLFEGQRKELTAGSDLADEAERAAERLAIALGADFKFGTLAVDTEDVRVAVERAKPALDALGISAEKLTNMSAEEQDHVFAQIRRWLLYADTDAGKVNILEDAIAGLGTELGTAEQRAADLTDALSDILDPKINLASSRNDWQQFLQGLGEDLHSVENPAIAAKEAAIDALRVDADAAKTDRARDAIEAKIRKATAELEALREAGEIAGSRSLFDGSEGALQNQDVIIEGVRKLREVIDAEIEKGASPAQVARVFKAAKQGFLDTAEEAGLSRREVEKYIRTLGLTPKVVKTLIQASEVEKAHRSIRHLNFELDKVGRTRTIKVTADGVGLTLPSLIAQDGQTNALGGFYPAAHERHVRRFAEGGMDVANGHQPQIAHPSGTVRVWAEPETQGETYIPHANDYRRPMAKQYLEQTAHLFGGKVDWFAAGGMVSRAVPATAGGRFSGLSDGDVSRLASAMLAARPLYGDVHVNGDPTVFRQQMQDDAARNRASGIRWGGVG